jgi:hypothetical protein
MGPAGPLLRSQRLRMVNHQGDALRLGMNWTEEDLGKPQVLVDVKTTGRYPAEYFSYAGGVPAVMLELREMPHLGCLTVTGKTLGENLEEIEHDPFFFAERRGYLIHVSPAPLLKGHPLPGKERGRSSREGDRK